MQALVDVVKQGKALYVGISRWPLRALEFAEKYLRDHDVPMLIYQDRVNLLDYAPIEEGKLKFCIDGGIGFIGFSPLAQGVLTNRYLNGVPDSRMALNASLKQSSLTPELLEKLRALNLQAEQRGETLAATALSWVLKQHGVTSVIVGVSSVEQLADNLKAVESIL